MENTTDETLLQINNISVVYSDVIQVLKGVSLKVPRGRIVSLLGSNVQERLRPLGHLRPLKPENGEVRTAASSTTEKTSRTSIPKRLPAGHNPGA
jgi:ABC-type branched-subunit amino acid transport system ATPase component